jgi:hypothetical protein
MASIRVHRKLFFWASSHASFRCASSLFRSCSSDRLRSVMTLTKEMPNLLPLNSRELAVISTGNVVPSFRLCMLSKVMEPRANVLLLDH